MKQKSIKNVFLVSLILVLIGFTILIAIVWINYSLAIGWLIGSAVSLVNFSLNYIVTIKAFQKRSKGKTIFWIILKSNLTLIIQASFLIAILFVNQAISGNYFYSPINIFTYIGGISVVLFGVIISQIVPRKGKNGQSN